MGTDLSGIINSTPISLEYLAGRKIAIDAYNALYQFLSTIRQRDGTPLMDYNGKVTSHLSGIFYRTTRLIGLGIRPIYVFDGKPSELKRKTIEARSKVREDARKEWADALHKGDMEKARTKAQASSKLTNSMIEDSKHLLGLMGVPCIQAPGEGEAQASYLALKGEAYACASQDYDALLFGSPLLVKNFTMSGRRKLPRKDTYVDVMPELIDLNQNLTNLGITREKLIWMALLIGTDFNEGVKGIGAKKAYKIVKDSSTLNEVISKSGGEFEVDPEELQKFFMDPAVTDSDFDKGEFVQKELREFLKSRAFSPERIENSLKTLNRSYNDKGVQSRLDTFQ